VKKTGSRPGSDGPELSRDLGFFAVFTTATGTMIGAGIFVLPGVAAEGAGPGAALSFLFAGIIAAMAGLSVSELATAMPKAGGPYYFASRAMGPMVGTVVGLGAWLALILKGSFALVGLGQYVLLFSPMPVLTTAAVGGLFLLMVNLVGAKASGVLQNVIVLVLLAILGAFVGKGLFAVDGSTLRPLLPFGWNGVFTTTGLVFISYLGIVKAAAVAEEVENPGRNLPLGILSSIVLVTVLYVATMIVVTGVLPMPDIISANAPLADAGAQFFGAAGAMVVGVAGILATLSTGNAAVLSSSRYPFAMARDALMTPWIAHIHKRFQTPSRAILVTGGAMIALALTLDVEGLAKLGGVFGMIVFAIVNLSVIMLRRTAPEWYQPSFRVPFYPVLPWLGAIAALAPIPQLGTFSHVGAGILILSGVAWYYWQRRVETGSDATIQPLYGLRDKLREIGEVRALEETRRVAEAEPQPEATRVLVELVEGKPNKHLLAVATSLAHRDAATVEAIVVTEVPPQSPLHRRVSSLPAHWVETIHQRMEAYDVPFRFHDVLARDRSHAILSFAQKNTTAVLLDWHDDFLPVRIRGSYVDRVLQRSPVRVGVLKYRGHKRYDRILVATAGSPYATAEVELADAVASMTGAELTLLMVLPTNASQGRREQARNYLSQLASITETEPELRILQGDDVAETILDAGTEADLIVLGAARPTWKSRMTRQHLVGPIADAIAERAEGSVLVTKDPGRRSSWRTAWGAGSGNWHGRSEDGPPCRNIRRASPTPR
jgi:amino acid transporter/nucleotide-binding universal stress UspA family protein